MTVLFQSVLRKVTPADAPQISDPIMTALLQMLSSSSGKSSGVQEDALLAVSTLVEGRVYFICSDTICRKERCNVVWQNEVDKKMNENSESFKFQCKISVNICEGKPTSLCT